MIFFLCLCLLKSGCHAKHTLEHTSTGSASNFHHVQSRGLSWILRLSARLCRTREETVSLVNCDQFEARVVSKNSGKYGRCVMETPAMGDSPKWGGVFLLVVFTTLLSAHGEKPWNSLWSSQTEFITNTARQQNQIYTEHFFFSKATSSDCFTEVPGRFSGHIKEYKKTTL